MTGNKIEIPEDVKSILRTLNKNGYEGYIVGGAVRDYIMGAEPHDWDITTNALPEQVKALFGRTIDTGLKHGTVTAMLNGEGYEITTYRADGDYSDGRHPDSVDFVSDIKEDLARRDFTINAMAMDIDGNVVDPFGGQKDLELKRIRCVGDPDERFREDALRMLRAVRFESKFGFAIEPETFNAIQRNASRLSNVSAERIREEFTKMLVSENPTKGFIDAYNSGITKIVLPEFDVMMECSQRNPYHYTNVGEHSLAAVEAVRPDPVLRWSALLHDVGKPDVKFTVSKDGVTPLDHFYGHARVSMIKSKEIMERLKFTNHDIKLISQLVDTHDYMAKKPAKLREFAGKYGREFLSLLGELKKADALAHTEAYRDGYVADGEDLIAKMNGYLDDGTAITKHDLDINGNELVELGLKGPAIGEFIDDMYRACLSNPGYNNNAYIRARAITAVRKNQNKEMSRPKAERTSEEER